MGHDALGNWTAPAVPGNTRLRQLLSNGRQVFLHARCAEEVMQRLLIADVPAREQPDKFHRDLRGHMVERPARVVHRPLVGSPERTALDDATDGLASRRRISNERRLIGRQELEVCRILFPHSFARRR